jgi:hypothetical protein
MAGTGIHSLAKLRGQMPQFATAGITPWQTALKGRDVNVHKTNSFFIPDFQFVSISKRNVIIYSW